MCTRANIKIQQLKGIGHSYGSAFQLVFTERRAHSHVQEALFNSETTDPCNLVRHSLLYLSIGFSQLNRHKERRSEARITTP